MRLGLVARADASGLGVQTHELYRHLNPASTLVIDVGHLYDTTEHSNKRTDLSRYPGALVCKGWEPSRALLEQFLDGVDVVLTCETPYSFDLYTLARQRGIRTVCQYNYEFLPHIARRDLPMPDLLAAPSLWHWNDTPLANKIHLPVPIARDRFARHTIDRNRWQGDAARCPNKGPLNVLHVVGRPAHMDRNGTPDLIDALKFVKSHVHVKFRCQHSEYLSGFYWDLPANVTVTIDASDAPNYWGLYSNEDIMVMPRRFGGLCLPINEALGAGMPVIMPNIDPNNTWLPSEWLVPASKIDEFWAMNRVDVYQADARALAAKIDQFAEPSFLDTARIKADQLAHEYSWETLKKRYLEVLS